MSKWKVVWKNQAVPKDLHAAADYLSLLYPPAVTRAIVKRLGRARRIERAAKDLLRASNLPLLDAEDAHVAADLKRIRKAKPLSPVLLVQGDMAHGVPLVIADGYHRICAAYHFAEDAGIACQMAAVSDR